MPAARTRTRRGIATFEFVLVFPVLLMLVSALFLVARADIRRTLTATAARSQAWGQTATAPPGKVLELGNDPAASAVTASPTAAVEHGPLFPRDTFTARSKLTATGRTWDYRDVPFKPRNSALIMMPHWDELLMIAKSVTNIHGILDNFRNVLGKLVIP